MSASANASRTKQICYRFCAQNDFGADPDSDTLIYQVQLAMRRGTLLTILGLALALIAVAIGASVLHDGLSAKATPTRLEAFVARNARHLAVPRNASLTQNPLLDSPEIQREGMLHFADHCAICHGNDGSGDTPIGSGLYPKPPDLRKPATQELSDGELFWIIENGVRFTGMPAFSNNENHSHGSGNHGGGLDSWKLVHFIRHLPHLTVAERLEMEQYNPKGPADRAEEQEEEQFLNEATPKARPESQTQKKK